MYGAQHAEIFNAFHRNALRYVALAIDGAV